MLKIEERDLKEIGIKAKGHRIKLRESIKKLRELTKQKLRQKISKSFSRNSRRIGGVIKTPQIHKSMNRSIE